MKRALFPSQVQNPQPPSHDRGKVHFADRLAEPLARCAERTGEKALRLLKLHWLGIINLHLSMFIAGALLAPVLQYVDQGWVSKILQDFFGLFCHQKESRCILIMSHPAAICARCLSFYSSCLVLGIWVSLRKSAPLDLKSAVLLLAPGMVDVLLQVLHIKESSNLLRTSTGALAGLAFSGYLIPRAQQGMRFWVGDDTKVPSE